MRLIRFGVILLAVLSFSVSVGHVMQLPARMAWDQYLWVGSTAQGGFFRLSGPLGILLETATVISLLVLALLTRQRGGSGLLYFVAAGLYGLGLILWWIMVYPVNVELAEWVNGPVPDTWTTARSRWEWGQAANSLLQFLGFAALLAALPKAKTW
jgi:hypothetical protein